MSYNEPDKDEQALLDAVKSGDHARVKTLLDAGTNPYCYATSEQTLFELARERNDVATCKLIIESGKRYTKLETWNHLFNVTWSPELVAWRLACGDDPMGVDARGSGLMAVCAGSGSAESLRLLAKAGADVHVPFRMANGRPLPIAVIGSIDHNPQMLETIIALGADVCATRDSGETALHEAVIAYVNDEPFDERVIEYVNDEPFDAFTRKASALIKAGLNINARNNEGKTALHYAACIEFCSAVTWLDAVAWLLDHGADPEITDNKNETPADLSIRLGDRSAATLIASWKARQAISTLAGVPPKTGAS